MSFHDRGSELSRINREAFYKPVLVHPWTWRVLKSAREFARTSEGVFDITTAGQLVTWNYLPTPCLIGTPRRSVGSGQRADFSTGSWRDIIFEKNRRVRFRRPVTIDLGGIAKGFAVDRAVDALEHHGVTTGIVNAGGDLRVFGPRWHLMHIRNPTKPTQAAGAVRLCERAMATSGIYFAHRKHRRRCVSPLLNGRTRRAVRELISVTVGAADCMTADALTKIVFILRAGAARLLARYGADALLLERDGAPVWMFHPPCDTSLQS
jgi:thiamine biosynthesis lipoprotein